MFELQVLKSRSIEKSSIGVEKVGIGYPEKRSFWPVVRNRAKCAIMTTSRILKFTFKSSIRIPETGYSGILLQAVIGIGYMV